MSKCPNIRRKKTTILFHRVRPGLCKKAKAYFGSVGSPCTSHCIFLIDDCRIMQVYGYSCLNRDVLVGTHNMEDNTMSD